MQKDKDISYLVLLFIINVAICIVIILSYISKIYIHSTLYSEKYYYFLKFIYIQFKFISISFH